MSRIATMYARRFTVVSTDQPIARIRPAIARGLTG